MTPRCWRLTLAAAIVVGTAAIVWRQGKAVRLEPGQEAPSFELVGTDGRTHRLADYRGKQAVVLAWFPKAFTGG